MKGRNLCLAILLSLVHEVFLLNKYEKLNLVYRNSSDIASSWKNGTAYLDEDKTGFRLSFEAFNQTFHINLTKRFEHVPVFSGNSDYASVTSNSTSKHRSFLNDFLFGRLEEKPDCKVEGYFINELPKLSLYCSEDIYHLEPIDELEHNMIIIRSGNMPFLQEDNNAQGRANKEKLKLPMVSLQNDGSSDSSYQNKSCRIHLIADHTFKKTQGGYQSIFKDMSVALVQVDKWFRKMDFNGDGRSDDFGFEIAKMTVLDNKYKNYQLSSESLKPKEVLDKLSSMAADPYIGEYCLVLLFTSRDFSPKNTQGLAVNASPKSSLKGGVCANVTKIKGKGERRPNVAFVTYVNHERQLTNSVIQINIAHVLGHSLGAIHDDDTSCKSNNPVNWYLMSSVSNRPVSKNNVMFSKCSIDKILPVLRKKGSCFEKRGFPLPRCGDGLVQGNEECDCGNENMCSTVDPCCNLPTSRSPCRLSRHLGSECSPMASECCDERCHVINATEAVRCNHDEDGCMRDSFCTGRNASCPLAEPDIDFRACQRNSRMCFQGKCTLSPCFYKDNRFEECTCSGASECHVCCLVDRDCVPVSRLGVYAARGKVFAHDEGSPCAFGKGSCDRQGSCRIGGWDSAIDEIEEPVDTDKSTGFPKWLIVLLILLLILLIIILLWILCRRKVRRKQEDHYYEIVDSLTYELREVEPVALRRQAARLWALFPSAQREEVVTVAADNRLSESEMATVFLNKGYNMRTDFTRIKPLQTKVIQ